MILALKYVWIKYDSHDQISYRVGDGGVKLIHWHKDTNHILVIYDDRAMVLNPALARYMEITEA